MLPVEYDLRITEQRYREIRRQIAIEHEVNAARVASPARHTVFDTVRTIASRLHLTRAGSRRVQAAA